MRIAILYICTGKYNQFFDGFYNSCEKYFLRESEKKYFVWTDFLQLADQRHNVVVIPKECAGFPADSLFKFDMFLKKENELKEYDYIYFFNSNVEFVRPVGSEILPDESGLAMGVWPGKRERQHPMFYPYERNKKSLAYIAPYGRNYVYYMGGLNGGTSAAYLQLINALSVNIRDDYNRGIIAKVHDESHINAYLRTHRCKKIGHGICLPEEWIQDGDKPKIILRNKVLIDPYFNRGRKFTPMARIKKGINILWNVIRWYL